MYAVGVDVFKGNSTVAVLRSKSEVVTRPFDVAHNVQGFASLAERLNGLGGEIKIVMEHMGEVLRSHCHVPA